jgi:hypothetical protein
MEYSIRITGANEAEGEIDLIRLGLLANKLQEIANLALQVRLLGYSKVKPKAKDKINLKNTIRLKGLGKGSTFLTFECDSYDAAIKHPQIDMLNSEEQEAFLKETPMSLVIKSFIGALGNEAESKFLDKPLLKAVIGFQNVLQSQNENFIFLNNGSLPKLKLTKADFEKVKIEEENIRPDEQVLISGLVEEINYSKRRVKLLTDKDLVDAFLGEEMYPEDIANWFGRSVTISGILHYRKGGNRLVEIQRIREMKAGEELFALLPRDESVAVQIAQQLKKGKKPNPLSELLGKWPGDESTDELLAMLTK